VSDASPAASASEPTGRRRLPRHDLILIPSLILLTTIVLFAVAELGSRALWPSFHDGNACVVRDKQRDVSHSLPNCSVKDKIPEGPWVSYDYDECGYRTSDPCGPKPSGDLRIVFLGSSITQGYHVPLEQAYAELVSRGLSMATSRPVQDENLGYEGLSPLQIYRRVPEALELHPDLVILAVSPFDLEEKTDPDQLAARNNPAIQFNKPSVTVQTSFIKRLGVMAQASRVAVMAQHYLYSNTDTYMRLSLARGDKTDYLRAPLSDAWRGRFADFGLILKDMADRFHAAGIPFVLVSIPSHQIGALMGASYQPPGNDPFEFGRDVRDAAREAGALYIDGTEAIRNEPHPDRLFYLSESHLNAQGHALIARAVIDKLQTDLVPTLSTRRNP
jgi:lysophospholipase L1-like esterase